MRKADLIAVVAIDAANTINRGVAACAGKGAANIRRLQRGSAQSSKPKMGQDSGFTAAVAAWEPDQARFTLGSFAEVDLAGSVAPELHGITARTNSAATLGSMALP